MRKISLVLVLIMLVVSAPAIAAAGDKIVRFGTVYASPTGDLSEQESDPPFYAETTVEADAAVGLFTGFEYMINDVVGFDATLMYANHDVDAHLIETYDGEVIFDESATIGDVGVMPLFISAHFHFTRDKPFDLYAGPSVGYVMYGNVNLPPDSGQEDLVIDDDFGFGAVFGIDVPFGSGNWNFSSAVRYLKTGAEISNSELNETLDVDPWILQVGVGYRF